LNNPEKLPITGLNLEFEKYLHNYYKLSKTDTNIMGVDELQMRFLKEQKTKMDRAVDAEWKRRQDDQ